MGDRTSGSLLPQKSCAIVQFTKFQSDSFPLLLELSKSISQTENLEQESDLEKKWVSYFAT